MDAYAIEAKEKMEKSIAAFKVGLSKLRSGRANPAMLNGIMCDYYGEKMDITSLSSISMPEPRQLLVKPYSREDLKTIGSAIAAANLGINPQIEADAIRIIVPPLTGELRQQIAKEAKALAEEAKVSIRNVRRDALDLLKIDETMSDDYTKRVEDEIQKVVTESNKSVEDILVGEVYLERGENRLVGEFPSCRRCEILVVGGEKGGVADRSGAEIVSRIVYGDPAPGGKLDARPFGDHHPGGTSVVDHPRLRIVGLTFLHETLYLAFLVGILELPALLRAGDQGHGRNQDKGDSISNSHFQS